MKKSFITKSMPLQSQQGFTLIETLVAIFILALTIGALLTLTASGFFSIRYAKNDIVATNLLQESLEYIRNSRDTAAQTPNATWDNWIQKYQSCGTSNGCMINPYAQDDTGQVVACVKKGCTPLNYYTASNFYGYNSDDSFNKGTGGKGYATSFVRTITMESTDGGTGLVVTAKMGWLNGTHPKSVTQSIVLSKWNLQ